MPIGVLGISHKSAPLAFREQVAQVCSAYQEPDKVTLSTCNRTEIYFSHSNLADVQSQLFAELKRRLNHSFEHAFYTFFGEECFYHLLCVACGLDSALFLETGILGQVRLSYEAARAQGALSSPIHYFFQKALKLAKEARSRFPLFQSTLHLEGMIFQLVDSMLGENPSLLMVGNSDINRKIIHYFYRRKKGRITLVSRDLQTAYPFAWDYGLTLKGREELAQACLYDGIISATQMSSAEGYLISSCPLDHCIKLMIDLSVPRSINPDVGQHLPLINMEQMGELFAKAHTVRHAETAQVKNFLNNSVQDYTKRFYQKQCFLYNTSKKES